MNYLKDQKEFQRIYNLYMSFVLFTGILIITIIGYLNISFSGEIDSRYVPFVIESIQMESEETVFVSIDKVASTPIVYSATVIDPPVPTYRMEIDEKTYDTLLRVVEAEVTGDHIIKGGEELNYDEMLESKIRVAQVFMNRVEDNDSFKFIDSLYESLTYENASSTFKDGRFYSVEVTELTKEAVDLALLSNTEDYTEGALYFSSGTKENKYGDYLFTDKVGHSFFK